MMKNVLIYKEIEKSGSALFGSLLKETKNNVSHNVNYLVWQGTFMSYFITGNISPRYRDALKREYNGS